MTVRSLTVPMKAEGLTSFKIQYDYRTDQFRTAFMKEWEPDFDWSRYNKEFYDGSLMTDEVKYYNTVQTRELFAKYDLEDYLDQVEDLIRQGKHYGIEGYYHEGYDILFMSHHVRSWDEVSFTIQAQAKNCPLHPQAPVMKYVSPNQRIFLPGYEHLYRCLLYTS